MRRLTPAASLLPGGVTRLRGAGAIAACLAASLAVGRARATDLGIDSDLPLRLDDANPTDTGEVQFQSSFRYERTHDHEDTLTIEPRLKWGVATDIDVHVQTSFAAADGDRGGTRDVEVGSEWRVVRERGYVPDLALELELDAPSGVRSAGLDTEVEGVVTKTLTDGPSHDQVHLNATWTHDAAARPGDRDDRYTVIAGYTRTLAPFALLVADVVREQQSGRRMDTNLVEVGMVAMAGSRVELAAGIGAGIGEESPDFVAVLAVQVTLLDLER
jgi:hypothetical protein